MTESVTNLKVAIIGCGGIGMQKHLPALSQVEGVELVAFCDLIEERALAGKAKFGTSESNVYTNYQKASQQRHHFTRISMMWSLMAQNQS